MVLMSDTSNIHKDFFQSPCECCQYYCYSHVWSLALVPEGWKQEVTPICHIQQVGAAVLLYTY